jgi:hypothetical protein
MSHDDDSALGGFLGLVLLGATAVFSYKSGQKKAFKEMNDQKRDEEIFELKKQIEILKLEKK